MEYKLWDKIFYHDPITDRVEEAVIIKQLTNQHYIIVLLANRQKKIAPTYRFQLI